MEGEISEGDDGAEVVQRAGHLRPAQQANIALAQLV